jgi:hypothetical protein
LRRGRRRRRRPPTRRRRQERPQREAGIAVSPAAPSSTAVANALRRRIATNPSDSPPPAAAESPRLSRGPAAPSLPPRPRGRPSPAGARQPRTAVSGTLALPPVVALVAASRGHCRCQYPLRYTCHRNPHCSLSYRYLGTAPAPVPYTKSHCYYMLGDCEASAPLERCHPWPAARSDPIRTRRCE